MLRREILLFVFGFSIVTILYHLHYASKQITTRSRFIEAPKSVPKLSLGRHDETLAKFLFNEVKIVCMVMTYPQHHNNTDHYIERTWGKRCNKLVFVSSQPVKGFDTIVLNFNETRDILWAKTRAGFQYLHEHYINDYDWFMKADDDK